MTLYSVIYSGNWEMVCITTQLVICGFYCMAVIVLLSRHPKRDENLFLAEEIKVADIWGKLIISGTVPEPVNHSCYVIRSDGLKYEIVTWRGHNTQWWRGDYSFRLHLIAANILFSELFHRRRRVLFLQGVYRPIAKGWGYYPDTLYPLHIHLKVGHRWTKSTGISDLQMGCSEYMSIYAYSWFSVSWAVMYI